MAIGPYGLRLLLADVRDAHLNLLGALIDIRCAGGVADSVSLDTIERMVEHYGK